MLAQPLAQKTGSEENIGLTYNLLGELYQRFGHYAEAINYFNDEIALRKKMKDSIGVANAHISLAFVYGDWKKKG